MAQIPDTLSIAAALNFVDVAPLSSTDIAKVRAAVERLRVLHTLGATDEAVKTNLQSERDAARVERDARPTRAEFEELERERDELRARVAELTAPPEPPTEYTVPIVQFRAALIPLRIALVSAPPEIRAVWGAILPELDYLQVVYPRVEPVSGLLDSATEHGLLSAEQVRQIKGL